MTEETNSPGSATAMHEHWDQVITSENGAIKVNFHELWKYRDLLVLFVKRDIVTVYKQTILGPAWFVIQPIMTTVVFLFVFGNLAGIPTDGIPQVLFYLSGITIWNYFSDTLTVTSRTFTENAGIFGKVYFPRLILPLSKVLSGLIKFLIQFAMFLAFWIFYLFVTKSIHPNIWILSLPFLLLLMAGLGLGFGLVITSLTTKYRDLTFLIAFGIQLLMYATPIIYPMSTISEKYRLYIWLNPLSSIVETFKYAFLGNGSLSLMWLGYSTLFTITLLVLGMLTFNKTEKGFIDTV